MMREEVRDGLVNNPSSQQVSMVAMPINVEPMEIDPDFLPPENEDESGRAAGAAAAADEGDVEGGGEGEGEDVARQLSNEELDDQA